MFLWYVAGEKKRHHTKSKNWKEKITVELNGRSENSNGSLYCFQFIFGCVHIFKPYFDIVVSGLILVAPSYPHSSYSSKLKDYFSFKMISHIFVACVPMEGEVDMNDVMINSIHLLNECRGKVCNNNDNNLQLQQFADEVLLPDLSIDVFGTYHKIPGLRFCC